MSNLTNFCELTSVTVLKGLAKNVVPLRKFNALLINSSEISVVDALDEFESQFMHCKDLKKNKIKNKTLPFLFKAAMFTFAIS